MTAYEEYLVAHDHYVRALVIDAVEAHRWAEYVGLVANIFFLAAAMFACFGAVLYVMSQWSKYKKLSAKPVEEKTKPVATEALMDLSQMGTTVEDSPQTAIDLVMRQIRAGKKVLIVRNFPFDHHLDVQENKNRQIYVKVEIEGARPYSIQGNPGAVFWKQIARLTGYNFLKGVEMAFNPDYYRLDGAAVSLWTSRVWNDG